MELHPLHDEPKRKVVALVLIILLAMIQATLLELYAQASPVAANADGVLSVGLLAVLAYWAWYVTEFVPLRQTRVLLTVVALLIWLAGCYAIQSLIEGVLQESYISFHRTLPFRIVAGGMSWTIIMLWYRIEVLRKELRNQEDEPPADELMLPAETDPALPDLADGTDPSSIGSEPKFTDRITVKDGSRIHLVEVEKLLYLQACGDYVTLITPDSQYVKEQTMKYYETHLSPDLFVRIHRSYIVNVTQISRVELFGKENYQMLLKNGTKLKMSLSGYRLLKEKLNL